MKLKSMKNEISLELQPKSDLSLQNGNVKVKEKKRKTSETNSGIHESNTGEVESLKKTKKVKENCTEISSNSATANDTDNSQISRGKAKRKLKETAVPPKVKKLKIKKQDENAENVLKNGKISKPAEAPKNFEHDDSSVNNASNVENEENDKSSDEDEAPAPTLSAKEVNELTAKYLRKSFNSASGLTILRKFVTICAENHERDLASEYINEAGNVLEILRLLETGEKKNMSNALLVFTAMHTVIMKILAKYPLNIPAAQEACHHFINSHLSTVHAMMSSQSNAKQRKVVLRLLTSIVALGDSLPRELLAHLSFHQQTVDMLAQQTKPTDPQSVRTCFIHFVLAFLVDGRVSVVRALLDKRGLLSSIFPELIYDSHTTVHLVLSTIKKYVLENSGISKTTKLHVFSTPVVQSLVSLYNWKGPKCWPGFKGKKKKIFTEFVDLEEKEIAVEAVHDFLTVLLTSNRHGIIFTDKSLGTTGRKHNQLVNTVLQSLERPWDHEKPCDLVSKVLAACPDLIKPQLTYTEPFLEPRPSKKWIAVVTFVKKILESIEPEGCLKSSLPEFTSAQLASATLTLTMPSLVLRKAVVPSVGATSIVVRHEAIDILTIMFRQLRKFLSIVEKNVSESEYLNLETNVKHFIAKNVPTVEVILKAWTQTDEPTENTEELELAPKKSEYFSGILELLQAYHDVYPECTESNRLGDAVEDSTTLLTSLDDLDDVDEEKLNLMKVQAIQIIQMLGPGAFTPEEKFFGKTLQFLISLMDNSSKELSSKGRQTVKMLLRASKIFENCEDQMDIWLNSFGLLQTAEEKREAARYLVKIVPKAVKRTGKYLELVRVTEQNRAKPVNNKKSEKSDDEVIDTKLLQSATRIPPILCAAFESLRKNSNDPAGKFISIVTIFTLHCQVSPAALIHLSEDVADLPRRYLNSWKTEERPIPLKKVLSKHVIGEFSKILLSTVEVQIEEILEAENGVKSVHDLLSVFRMTVFYLSQFIQREKLDEEQFNHYKKIIIALLKYSAASVTEDNINCTFECSKYLLTHPTLLQHFCPIPRAKNEIETILTVGLVDVFRTIVDVNQESDLEKLFLPFKNKLMLQLRTVLKKCAGSWRLKKSHCLIELIETLQLLSSDLQELLKRISNLPKESFLTEDKKSLSIWGDVTPKLIELLSNRKNLKPVSNSSKELQVVHKICIFFTHLKSTLGTNVENWEKALLVFFKNFPYNLSAVDPKTFGALLENVVGPSTVQLISFLTGRNAKLIPLFVKNVSNEESGNSDIIFPVISSNLSYQWDQDFLTKIYKQHKKEITAYFSCSEEPPKWINENTNAVAYLIDRCFTQKTCEKIALKILSSGDKLEIVDLSYVKLLTQLFTKLSSLKEPQEVLPQLLQILIRVLVSALKKSAKDEEKIELLCRHISETIAKLKSKEDFTLEELSRNHAWPQFTRFSLKLGLRTSKEAKKVLPLLKTLSEACEIAYKDKIADDYVKTLFEMTTSHSEFVNLMLSSGTIKKDLLKLLYVLTKKNPSVMTSSHIPLYLSAYGATLSECDQQILLILQHYESSGIKLTDYSPYLFGEAAASHYSVRGGADTAIWRQPTTSQVLDLLSADAVVNTIKHFPVDRELRPNELQTSESIYDPAFYLPLLVHLLADNNVVACHKVTQSGALALAFAACGSTRREIRMTAFTVIARFYFHLEATGSKEKLLWMRLIDAVRNGIAQLECPLDDVRINCFVSTFLAKSSLVTTQPLHPLYSPLQKFFMAKPQLDLKIIPEFLTLFNSSDINHRLHRQWILEVIGDAVRTELDVDVASRCFLFRALFYFYGCNLVDATARILILRVIGSTVKIAKAGMLLCRNGGLLVWLGEAASRLGFRDIESIELIISIVRCLLDSVLKSNDHESHIQFMLLDILKTLIPKLTKNITIACYIEFLRSIRDILQNKSLCQVVHKREIQSLLEVMKNVVGGVSECTEILTYGCEFVTREKVPETGDQVALAKFYLRSVLVAWRSQIKS